MVIANELLFLAIEAIYDAASDPAQWPRALSLIAESFGDVGAGLKIRRQDGSISAIVSPSLVKALKEYEEDWHKHDFKAPLEFSQSNFFIGEPITDRHLVPVDEDYLTHPYNQFLARHGAGWSGTVPVSSDPHTSILLKVQRSFEKPEFSDDELKIVALFGRHVEKSLRLSLSLINSGLANFGLGETLERTGFAVFAVDGARRVLFANPIAQALIGDVFYSQDHSLSVSSPQENDLLQEKLSWAIDRDHQSLVDRPKPLLVRDNNNARRFVVYALPVSNQKAEQTPFLNGVRAILMAVEQRSEDTLDPAILRHMFNLTVGEARIAALIGAGMTPRDSAARLGISEGTARNVLKKVFSKVGVSRQSELVALVTRLTLR